MKLSLCTYLRRGVGFLFPPLSQTHLERKSFLLRNPPTSLPATSLPWSGEITCLAGQTRKQTNQNSRANHSCMASHAPGQTNSCCCTELRGDPFHPTHNCSSASLHLPKHWIEAGLWIVGRLPFPVVGGGLWHWFQEWNPAGAAGSAGIWQGSVGTVMQVGEGAGGGPLGAAELLRHTGGEWWHWGLSESHGAGVGTWHPAGKAGILPEGQAALGTGLPIVSVLQPTYMWPTSSPACFPNINIWLQCPAKVTVDFSHVSQNNIPKDGHSLGRLLKIKLLCISLWSTGEKLGSVGGIGV